MPRAEAGRAAVGRVDVQPHLVPPADFRHVHQRIERADRRRAGGRPTRPRSARRGPAGRPAAGRAGWGPCGGGRRARRGRLVGADAEDAGRAGDRVVGVGVGHQHRRRRRRSASPAVQASPSDDVAGGEQRGQIGQRAAGRDQAGERARGEAKLARRPRAIDGMLDGRGPGAHFVDRHHLVGDGAHQVEQPGQRHRARAPVADVPRMVEVLAAGERLAGQFGEAIGDCDGSIWSAVGGAEACKRWTER